MNLQLIIPRSEVEAMDCAGVRTRLDAMGQTTEHLWRAHGRVTFSLAGYDAHPDEIYMIPDIRRFLAQWHELAPDWLFWGSLHDESLQLLYFGLLHSVECLQLNATGICRVRFDRGELRRLLRADWALADACCARLGLSVAERERRARDIMTYFQLR